MAVIHKHEGFQEAADRDPKRDVETQEAIEMRVRERQKLAGVMGPDDESDSDSDYLDMSVQ